MSNSSIAVQQRGVYVRLFLAALALMLMFVLGSAGGYVARYLTTPATTTTTSPQVVSFPSPTPKQTILPNQA